MLPVWVEGGVDRSVIPDERFILAKTQLSACGRAQGTAKRHALYGTPHAPRVCVCMCFYYTPFSSVARGVPYLLHIERICLSSTQLTILKSLVGDTRREKEKGIKKRKGGKVGYHLWWVGNGRRYAA